VKFGQLTPLVCHGRSKIIEWLPSKVDLCETRNAKWNRSILSRSEASVFFFLVPVFVASGLAISLLPSIPLSLVPFYFLISNGEQVADRQHLIFDLFYYTDRRLPTAPSVDPFEERQRVQFPPSQSQWQQVRHQPKPQQPARFPLLLSGPGYQGGPGASSSLLPAFPSPGKTVPSFTGELLPNDQWETKPFYRGSSKAERPTIETEGAVPERKKGRKSPAVKSEPGTPPEEGASTSTSTGAATTARRRASTKVAIACNFCRGE
jgi:hypothetical protein